jgi:hypothetical protein
MLVGLPQNHFWAMCGVITKSKIEFDGPFLEQTNRVTREFPADRFLRVTFTLEEQCTLTYRKILDEGIRFGGRNFEFLCFSPSQLRERKCYFFASTGTNIIIMTF